MKSDSVVFNNQKGQKMECRFIWKFHGFSDSWKIERKEAFRESKTVTSIRAYKIIRTAQQMPSNHFLCASIYSIFVMINNFSVLLHTNCICSRVMYTWYHLIYIYLFHSALVIPIVICKYKCLASLFAICWIYSCAFYYFAAIEINTSICSSSCCCCFFVSSIFFEFERKMQNKEFILRKSIVFSSIICIVIFMHFMLFVPFFHCLLILTCATMNFHREGEKEMERWKNENQATFKNQIDMNTDEESPYTIAA